ncbi:MAG: Yip1 family protein [Chloroflexota bacterium]|nr:Yip1 family protein [Chloroflexota bacterium]
MQTIKRSSGLLWDALFLQKRAYATMRDDDNPFVDGLFILVMLGVAAALAGIIGTTLEWASSPDLGEIREIILPNLQAMPGWDMMAQEGGEEALAMFQQVWDMNWRIVEFFMPHPGTAAAGLILTPLGLIVGWLVIGVLAHLLARLFGGVASLSQTLGVTALAEAPQLLLLLTAIPFVTVAGITVWTLLCRYMGLRVAHELTWPRAMWAALLPPLIVGLLIAILFGTGVALFGATMAMSFTGGL